MSLDLQLNSLANLDFILNQHPHEIWNDRVSRRLRLWCDETRALSANDPQVLQNKCNELFSKILIKFNRPLKEPVLERGWVWEKKLFESYRLDWSLSPFDGKPMEDIRPHSFAQQIISWARSYLNSQTSQPSDSRAIVPASSQELTVTPSLSLEDALTIRIENPKFLAVKLLTYLILANSDLCREALERSSHQIDIISSLSERIAEGSNSRLQKGEESLRQSKLQSCQWVESSLQNIQKIHAGTHQIKEAENESLRERIRVAEQRLNQTEKAVKQNEQNIQQLEDRIKALQQSNAQMAAKLN